MLGCLNNVNRSFQHMNGIADAHGEVQLILRSEPGLIDIVFQLRTTLGSELACDSKYH